MSEWEPLESLKDNIESVARELNILNDEGEPVADPEDLTDRYVDEVRRVRVRAFLVLCSSEIEEFVETLCLDFVEKWKQEENENRSLHHHCFHALALHFRENLANLIEKGGVFIDFYASADQVRKMKPSKEGEDLRVLNKMTLVTRVSKWYEDEVVKPNHGISHDNLRRLLQPLGFSKALVEEECANLVNSLKGLASGRGEAAHRSNRTGLFPFKSLPPPRHQQMSAGDAWSKWVQVRDALPELKVIMERKPAFSE